jgi:hypothetical protein
MSVCTEDDKDHDAHCYHAHFLVFPGTHDVSEMARTYFAKVETFDELDAALSDAARYEEYVLISPTPERFNVFSGPLNLPRQLARFLVAHDANTLHLADWRGHPNRDRAVTIAANLRSLLAADLNHVGSDANE